MKAVTYSKYGSATVLQVSDIEVPVPNDNEVLIKVWAAGVNPLDWHFIRGTPYPLRLMTGLRKPKITRLGVDVAGCIEAVGKDVTRFKVGDEVFGSCRGAFAEYACASESTLVEKPDNVPFEQAASVSIAALTALQALRQGRIQQGKSVLINGAAGGVGTFAVQVSKSFGADVTGVCSTRNVDMIRSIGADHVFDYTRQNFIKNTRRYDLILDTVGNHSLLEYNRILNRGGIYVGVGGPSDLWMIGPIVHVIKAGLISAFGSKKFVGLLAKINKDDLAITQELLRSGKVTPVIDRCYKLTEIHEAITYLEEGHARGKVVITL